MIQLTQRNVGCYIYIYGTVMILKLVFHGADMDTDTDISDAPIV